MALIHVGGKTYELIFENKDGWKPEAFRDRYSEVLERYDYIIGDWGYNQLRLKGFFKDNHQKATKDSMFSVVSDYINEYCNFGCAYFILEKKQSNHKEPEDYDLDIDDQLPRLEGSDLRAAAGAVNSAPDADESGEGDQEEANEQRYVPASHHRPREHNRSDGGNSRKSGRRDHRRGYRGNDHRGKKPAQLAAGETAAAAERTENGKSVEHS